MIHDLAMTLLVLTATGALVSLAVPIATFLGDKMDDQPDLLTWTPPEAARDADLALVAENNAEWMGNALDVIEALPIDFRGIGEDIGSIVRARIGEPKSPNAWGALISRAKKRGLIQWTGQMAPMRGARSNARMSFVYTKGQMAEAAE